MRRKGLERLGSWNQFHSLSASKYDSTQKHSSLRSDEQQLSYPQKSFSGVTRLHGCSLDVLLILLCFVLLFLRFLSIAFECVLSQFGSKSVVKKGRMQPQAAQKWPCKKEVEIYPDFTCCHMMMAAAAHNG